MDEQQVENNTTFMAKYMGRDGDEGYMNGQMYTLKKWEENDMLFISREDGSGQVAYDSEESMKENWEMQQ